MKKEKIVPGFNLCDFDKQIETEMLHEKKFKRCK